MQKLLPTIYLKIALILLTFSPDICSQEPISNKQLWTHFNINNGLPDNGICQVIEDAQKNLLVVTIDNGIYIYDGQRFSPHPVNEQLPSLFINRVLLDKHNRLWIACNYQGIWILDNGKLYPFEFNHLFNNQHFSTLYIDQVDNVWIAANRVGLLRYDGNSCVDITKKHNLLNEDIIQIYKNNNDGIYLLYVESGLYYFKYNSDNTLLKTFDNSPPVQSFHFSKSNETWLIRQALGITKISSQKEIIIFRTTIDYDGRNDHFTKDTKNRIWFATNNNVHCYNNGYLFSYQLESSKPRKLYQDYFENIWVCTDNGLYKYSNPNLKSWELPDPIITSQNRLPDTESNSFMYSNRAGQIWFTGKAGQLYYFDSKTVKQFTFPDSLNYHINAIGQDSSGLYWFGTKGQGVICWDGHNFSRPTAVNDKINGTITKIYTDRKGRTWIGCISPLPHFANRKNAIYRQKTILPKATKARDLDITCLYVDEYEKVWLGTLFNKIFYSKNSRFVKAPNIIYDGPYITNMQNFSVSNNILWGNAIRGIFNYNLHNESFQFFHNPSKIADIPSLDQFNWIQGDYIYLNNVQQYSNEYKNYNQDITKPIYNISAISKNPNNGLWIGSYSVGLFFVNKDTLVRFNAKHGLPSLGISSLYRDKGGTLWVGTLDHGLYKWDGEQFIQTDIMKKAGKSIYTFFQDSQQRLWIGTLDNGLVRLSNTDAHIFKKGLLKPIIWGIGEGESGNIYVCTNKATFAKLDKNNFENFSTETILKNADLRQAFKNKNINIRTYFLEPQQKISSGLLCWDGRYAKSFSVNNGLPGHEITDIIQTADDKIWVSTFNTGIAVLEGDHFVKYDNADIQNISRMISLHASKDSALWVLSQDEGLVYIKSESVKSWRSESKMISINPLDIKTDSKGRPVFSSYKNCYFFNEGSPQTIPNLVLNGPDVAIWPFFHIDENNKIWFTTNEQKLYSHQMTDIKPIVRIESCQIGDDSFSATKLNSPIFTDYKQKACAIEFNGYHSSFPPQQIKYSYSISKNGQSSQWSPYSSSKRLLYTNLEAGNTFNFNFRARTPNGLVAENAATLEINIAQKPVHLRVWFFWTLLSLLFLVIALYFVYRYYKINRLIIRRKFNPYIAGEPILKPDLFFGREQVLSKILSILHNNSIMICGERRIGKTSILFQIKRLLENGHDKTTLFRPVFVDLQGVGQWEFFHIIITDIIEQLCISPKAPGIIGRHKTDNYNYRDFSSDFRNIIQHLSNINSQNLKIVLLIDEADAMNEYDQVIHAQLRRIFMQEYSANFAAIIAGTNYIQNWNRPESPWWNLFTLIELDAIAEKFAKKLIQSPVKGIFKFTNEAIETLLIAAQNKPYRIQLLCIHVINLVLDEHRRKIRKSDVESVIEKITF